MVGQVLGAVGHLPNIYTELEVSYYLLRRLLGVRTEGMSILYYLYPARGLLLPAQQASGRQDRGYVYLVLHFRKKRRHNIAVLGIRNLRIRMFLGLPDPDPLVRSMDPNPSRFS
jgi:hypothetical protein